jgi:hypothetical protein
MVIGKLTGIPTKLLLKKIANTFVYTPLNLKVTKKLA